MKKNMLFAFMAMFLGSFTMVSCGGSNGNAEVSKKDTPTDAVVKVLDLFKEAKYYEAIMLCKDADQEPEDKVKSAAELVELAYGMAGGLVSYEILGETIDDDGQNAVVDVNFVYGKVGEKKDKVFVAKTDKGWQVVLE